MIKKIALILFLYSLSLISVCAQQLCDGNLGVNIFEDGSFGSGTANVITVDPQIAPGYIYRPDANAPMDGFYNITNDISQWNFVYDSWIKIPDNSDDPNGYMMVVNASFEPGLFYEKEVDGLCENTLYEFSTDVINLIRIPVSNHIEPNIDFLINDIVQFSSGDVPQDAEWHKYGFTFTTEPGQTSVKLSLRNNAPGGIGNDLALDNIRFQACGPAAFITADETIFVCESDNNPVEIRAEIAAANQALQWQLSLDSISWMDIAEATEEFVFHELFDVGKYYYRYISAGTASELQNEKCRIISDVLTVEVLPLDYEVYDTICFNESYSFGGQILDMTGSYYEEFTSIRGCDSFVDLNLFVLEQESLELDTVLIDPLCHDSADGSIEINVLNGNNQPYTFAINEVTTQINIFNGLTSGNYTITITNNRGCAEEVLLTLDQPDELIIQLPDDTLINLGESLEVEVQINQTITDLIWDPLDTSPCGTCLEFSFIPLLSQNYTAEATNENGCKASDAFQVIINIDNLKIYIPNIISPRLSGPDNIFTIGAQEGLISQVVDFSVYDRWGSLVHRTENSTDLSLWDGRINNNLALPGVYVYLLTLELIDGNEYFFSDDFLLIR